MRNLILITFWLSFLAFAWTYFGYPLLMLVWAKVAPQGIHQDNTHQPSVTLLIPAHNEADVIKRKVENSLALRYPREKLEILVVDDGSDDGTDSVVASYAAQGVTLVRQNQRSGKMNAVNVGFERAAGEIVVLSDASPSYKSDAIELLTRNFVDQHVGVVVGTLALWDATTAVAKPAGLYWKYEAALRRWESRTGNTVAVHGNMFAIRRSLFRPLKTSTINDEFSLAMEVIRQGFRVIYEPDAMSYDDASGTMRDEFNRRVRINAGRFQALFSAGYLDAPTLGVKFRLISHKLLRPLTPVLMLLLVFSNIGLLLISPLQQSDTVVTNVLSMSGGFQGLALVLQVLFYSLALLGWLAEQRGLRNRLLTVPYYFVSSNVAALFGLWRWLRGTQRVTWQKRSN